jgi:hypothetical protein
MEKNMGNEIRKPLPVLREEFVNALTDMINNSQLPRFVIESILKDFYSDMKVISRKEYEIAKQQYENAIKNEVE